MNLRKQFFKRAWLFKAYLNVWGPYRGAGIRVVEIASDYRRLVVEMRETRLNRNAVGTHFGGSLYSMCDPFYMLLFMANLGRDYVVWDKAASIDFQRPGKGTVRAVFTITEAQLDAVRAATALGERYTPTYLVDVMDEQGERVARIEKVLYFRRKDASRKR